MGIGGFFCVLLAILMVGISITLYLAFRRSRLAWMAAVATAMIAGGWYLLPLVDSVASVLFFPEDTIYSPGYSEAAFRHVTLGQYRAEVAQHLGRPMEISSDGGSEYWYYSRHGPHHKNYWTRIIVFSGRDGRVSKKIGELYSD